MFIIFALEFVSSFCCRLRIHMRAENRHRQNRFEFKEKQAMRFHEMEYGMDIRIPNRIN